MSAAFFSLHNRSTHVFNQLILRPGQLYYSAPAGGEALFSKDYEDQE